MLVPPKLSVTDKIAIVAPAGKLDPSGLERSTSILESWGLEVVIGKQVFGDHYYFSASDDNRLNDLQQAIDDKTVKAILAARGGYGVTRILERIDFADFMQNPKWLIGFSDLTAIHLKLNKLGFCSIHGPMGTSLGQDVEAAASLKRLLFNYENELISADVARVGEAQGELIGGNLSLLLDSLGTPTELETTKKILFIEEIGEQLYRLDRMFQQLLRAGKLTHLAGLVVGHLTDITDSKTQFGKTAKEIISEIAERFSYPVAFDFNTGHEANNQPLVEGGFYKLKAEDQQAKLSLIH